MKLRVLSFILVLIMAISSLPVFGLEANGYDLTITSTLLGNIFDTTRATFTVSVLSPKSETLSVVCKAVDDNGVVRGQYNKNQKVTAGTSSRFNFRMDTGSYGVFKLKVELYSGDSFVCTEETEFSVVKKTTNINEEMGICTGFNRNLDLKNNMSTILSLFSSTGFSIYREGWAWDQIERNMGKYSFAPYQDHADALIATGRDFLVTLTTGNAYYTGTDQQYATTPEALEAWYNYCYNLALFTKDYPITFEVANEYDLVGSAQEYYNLLTKAYTAVKAANPNAKVFGMTASSAGTTWMKQVLDLGGANYMDGITCHPYAWDESPESFDQMEKIDNVRQLMDENGMENKELWLSEVGWYKQLGQDKQASYSVRFLALNKIHQYVDRTMFYTSVEVSTSKEGYGFINSEVADVPYSAFAVFPAIANYNAIMTDAQYVKPVADSCYMYTLKDGRSCVMLWADKEKQISLDLGVDSVVLTDMYGNEQTIYGNGGKYTFIASDNISYITGAFSNAAEWTSVIGLNKCISYNKDGEFDQITFSGAGQIEVAASENIDAFVHNGTLYVSNPGEKDGYAYVKLMSGGNCYFSGKIKAVKLPPDKSVIYDMENDGFSRFTTGGRFKGVWPGVAGGEDALCMSFATKERGVTSPEFTAKPTGTVRVGYDIYLTGNVDTVLTNEYDSSTAYMIGTSSDGYFGYGRNKTSETKINYETGKWYHLESIVDLTNKSIKHYVDGVYIGTETWRWSWLCPLKNQLSGVSLGVTASSDSTETFIKNLRVSQYMEESLGIEDVTVAEDNSYAIVKFSNAVSKNEKMLRVVSVLDRSQVSIYDVLEVSPTQYKIVFDEPLENNKAYTITMAGDIESPTGHSNGADYTFVSTRTEKTPTIVAVYSIDDETRPISNSVSADGSIAIELSEAASGTSLSMISLIKDDNDVEKSVTLSPDGRFIIVTPADDLEEGGAYTLDISGVMTAGGVAFDSETCIFDVFNTYQSIMHDKRNRAKNSVEVFREDFESYTSSKNAGSELTFIDGGKWSASKVEVKTEQWWGFGHYVYDMGGNKVLKGDAWQNGFANDTKASAIIQSSAITSGEYEVEFDLCVNVNPANEGSADGGRSYFSLMLENASESYLIFNVENEKMLFFESEEEIDTGVGFPHSLTDFTKVKVRVDMDADVLEVSIVKNGKEYAVYKSSAYAALWKNGFNKVSFVQSNSGVVQGEGTSHLVDNVVVSKVNDALGIKISKNNDDFYISQIAEGDELSAKVGVDSARYKKCVLICAFYDNGILKKAELFDVETTDDDPAVAEHDFTTTVPEFENLSIKCMLFDGMNTIAPILAPVEK